MSPTIGGSGGVARDTVRLMAFSDGVFAIAITLLILEIRPPTDDEDLLHGLLDTDGVARYATMAR